MSSNERLDANIICLRGQPAPVPPLTGSLVVRLSGIFGTLEPGHLSLLVQICPSYQLHPEGQASPVCGLSIPPQPLVGVLAEHRGSFGSRCWDPGLRSPPPDPPPTRPKCTTHLQIGLVSVPHPGPAFPGAVPASGQSGHQQRECRVQGGVLSIHQEPHMLGPGMLRVRETVVGPPGVTSKQVQWSQTAAAGVTCTTRCKRLKEAWRCRVCSTLRQETWRSCGGWGVARAVQAYWTLPEPKSSHPHQQGGKNSLEVVRNLKSSCITLILFIEV